MADETDKSDTPEAEETAATIEEQVAELKEEAAQVAREAASTIERFFDLTLGAGALAAEKLDANLQRLWDDTPGVIAELEAKGRPIRTKLSDSLKGKMPTVTDAFKASAEAGESATEDEIETLENRVKELEKQVGDTAPPPPIGETGPTPPSSAPDLSADKSPFSMLEIDGESTGDAKPKRAKKTDAPEAGEGAAADIE